MNPPEHNTTGAPNILLITTDQQRYDSLGCNGNAVCATPAIDSLAAGGVRYERAHTQNVLCMPSRSTILTGQYPGTHGVWNNGVCLPRDAPSVASELRDAGYATALVGKIHFETIAPHFGEHLRKEGHEPLMVIEHEERDGRAVLWLLPATGAAEHRGFDHLELCNHVVSGHHAQWLLEQVGWDRAVTLTEESAHAFMGIVDPAASDTAAPQSLYSAMPPEYHSSMWAVERTLGWIDTVEEPRPFFCWLSFDDPHHPFNPPTAYGRRHAWRELALPPARPSTRAAIEADLAGKPWQYGAYWRGEFNHHEGAHSDDRLCDLSDDQLREIMALTYGMVELIDDALACLLEGLRRRGLLQNTHLIFTTDHGELLGDHGLLLKGPFHLDGLLRVPLIWRAPGATAGVVNDPVGLVDLAPTICSIAGVRPPDWMEGRVLPTSNGSRERVTTTYESHYRPELHLRSLFRDGLLVTDYPAIEGAGELYDLDADPYQLRNLWTEPTRRRLRDDLLADLHDHIVEDTRVERLPWWAQA